MKVLRRVLACSFLVLALALVYITIWTGGRVGERLGMTAFVSAVVGVFLIIPELG